MIGHHSSGYFQGEWGIEQIQTATGTVNNAYVTLKKVDTLTRYIVSLSQFRKLDHILGARSEAMKGWLWL